MEKEVSHLNTGKLKLNKLHSKLKLKLQKYSLEPPPPAKQNYPSDPWGRFWIHACACF